MKTERNILIAFFLNLSFAIFEFIGGAITGSVAIASDAIHDLGDAMSIGLSYFLERKSKQKPDDKHTYGYVRYSVLGGFITTMILVVGSGIIIYHAIGRIFNPIEINYNGMIIFAIIGVVVNSIASFVTREGDSINQKAVNLHMLEDVLGWVVVLIGAIIMKFTDITIIDSILSIFVALFILINSMKNLNHILDLFLEKTPESINMDEIKKHLLEIEGVNDIHHVHIWSLDGYNNFCTMHVVTDTMDMSIKDKVREELKEFGICHATLELEGIDEHCEEDECKINFESIPHGHHHHGHSHSH